MYYSILVNISHNDIFDFDALKASFADECTMKCKYKGLGRVVVITVENIKPDVYKHYSYGGYFDQDRNEDDVINEIRCKINGYHDVVSIQQMDGIP